MSRYMVTHSLLSSWQYAMRENPYEDATSQSDPKEDFLKVLRREPTPTTEAMQKGIDFENLVTDILSGVGDRSDKSWDAAKKVADELIGAQLQFKASTKLEVDGEQVLLYGRFDALKAGTIYDIKRSDKYERGKFFDSTQHPAYLRILPEAQNFVYFVSNGRDVWHEEYLREETADISTIISRFFQWLKATDLWGVFTAHWEAK